ncbi:MAG: SGNH/GDSL hydrolase family protein [Verrucomicrobiae bacterium]|nr:SGNH/GDSL hydrolase family protein [Verrucomicrobiae bacterium]
MSTWQSRLGRWLGRLFTLTIGLAVSLTLCEWTARWLRPDLVPANEMKSVPDPFIGWRCLPCQTLDGRTEHGEPKHIQTNNLGFPDEDHELAKAPGTTRIAVLGDSFAAAFHVNYPDSFVQVMKRRLQQDTPSTQWEVLNFGVTGFGTTRELAAWKYYAAPFKPDVVILAFFMGNDVANNLPGYDDTFAQRKAAKPHGWFYRTFLEPSLLYQQYKLRERDIRHRWRRDWSRKTSGEDARRPFWERSYAPIDWQTYLTEPPPSFQRAWQATEDGLVALHNETRASGARLAVVLLPGVEAVAPGLFKQSFPRYPGIEQFNFDTDYPHRRLLAFLKKQQIPLIDVQAAIEKEIPAAQRQQLYFKFDLHFTTRGHRLAGETAALELPACLQQTTFRKNY